MTSLLCVCVCVCQSSSCSQFDEVLDLVLGSDVNDVLLLLLQILLSLCCCDAGFGTDGN